MKNIRTAAAEASAPPGPAKVDPVVGQALAHIASTQAVLVGALSELAATRERAIEITLPAQPERVKRKLKVEITGRDSNGGIRTMTIEEI